MNQTDHLKTKATSVCRPVMKALAAITIGLTALTTVPQGAAAAEDIYKNCYGLEVAIVGGYSPTLGITRMRHFTVKYTGDYGERDNNEVKIYHLTKSGRTAEIANYKDLFVNGTVRAYSFNKSDHGGVYSIPPTRIRYEIKTDRPGPDARCKGTVRIRL